MRWDSGKTEGVVVAGVTDNAGNALNLLHTPYHFELDSNDNMIITDRGNHRILFWPKGAKQGIELAGSYGSAEGQLRDPASAFIAYDNALYISDYNNNRIQKLYPYKFLKGNLSKLC